MVRKTFSTVAIVGTMAFVAGCDEANLAIDSILGRQSTVLSAAATQPPSQSRVFAKKQSPGTRAPEVSQPLPPESPAPQASRQVAQGKKRPPGQTAPAVGKETITRPGAPEFEIGRDPFQKPTEVFTTGCPPSMPLCRFDRSQLKLVGVMQVSEGQYKGLVEDPDGRGYFVSVGTQIMGATVIQITGRGLTLHVHKTNEDVEIPLFESRDAFD